MSVITVSYCLRTITLDNLAVTQISAVLPSECISNDEIGRAHV